MTKLIEFIQQPWPWWVAGPLLTYVMFSLLYFGKGLAYQLISEQPVQC